MTNTPGIFVTLGGRGSGTGIHRGRAAFAWSVTGHDVSNPSDYVPSPSSWVANQVELIESSGGAQGMTMRDMPVILMTMRGAKSGKTRKVPVMRVEHDGTYAAVASKGGAPENPSWYRNLVANPQVDVRDGTRHFTARAREIHGAERDTWWTRAVAAYPDYADYATKTERTIPMFVLEPVAA